MKIAPEDFEAWRENEITRRLLLLLKDEAELAKEAWIVHSWQSGGTDPAVLYEMRGRAHICEMIEGLTVEDFEEDGEE